MEFILLLLLFRPLSEDEARLNTPIVISCNEGRREVSAVQNIANKQIDRTFAFDKVCQICSRFAFLYDDFFGNVNFEELLFLLFGVWITLDFKNSSFW